MCNRIGGCSDVETSTTNWILKQSVRDRARTVPRRRRNGDDPRLRFTRGDRPWLRTAKFCVKKSSIFRIILSASFNYAPNLPFRKENAWKISLSLLSFRALEGKNLICWLFFFPVKYLREVTPYFRKASIIQEVGWELQRGFLSATPPPPKSPPRADTRYLPLQLCRLTRAHPSSDPGKLAPASLSLSV